MKTRGLERLAIGVLHRQRLTVPDRINAHLREVVRQNKQPPTWGG